MPLPLVHEILFSQSKQIHASVGKHGNEVLIHLMLESLACHNVFSATLLIKIKMNEPVVLTTACKLHIHIKVSLQFHSSKLRKGKKKAKASDTQNLNKIQTNKQLKSITPRDLKEEEKISSINSETS